MESADRTADQGKPQYSTEFYPDSAHGVDSMMVSIINSSQTDDKLKKIVGAMESLCSQRFRTPLRDLVPHMFPFLCGSSTETVDLVLRALRCTGRGMVYYQELFEFLSASQLNGQQLAIFIYECGRHGLRCKHYLDKVVKNDPPNMNQEDVLRCLKGICKFASDYSDFVKRITVKLNYSSLAPSEHLVLLRVFKAIGDTRDFAVLVSRIDISSFTLLEKFSLLYLLKRSRTFKLGSRDSSLIEMKAISIVKSLRLISGEEIRSQLLTTDISDALDAMASMRIRNEELLVKIVPVLVDRIAEIKYSPICGLWQSITDSLGHLNHFDSKWMRIADEMASSEFNLKGFAAFQLIFFASCMGRLNFFSESAFTALTNVIASDIKSIQDVDMFATLLFPLQRAYFKAPKLIEAVVEQTSELMKKNKNPSRNALRGTLGVAYNAVLLGFNDKERIQQIVRYLIAHPIDKGVYTKQDLARMKRLVVLGHINIEDIPVSVREDDHFNVWGVSHSIHEKRVKEAMTESAMVGNSTFEFIDFCLPDGTAVVVEDESDPIMSTWKYPEDHRNWELIPIPTTGSRELIRQYLNDRGFTKIRFVSNSKGH
jgi:hypothetical protein